MNEPLLTLSDVSRDFDVSRPWLNRVLEGEPRRILRAVDGVCFEIRRGETLGAGRRIGLRQVHRGAAHRRPVRAHAPGRVRVHAAGAMQMIFQDPYASLNPRWRVRDIVAEPIEHLRLEKTSPG